MDNFNTRIGQNTAREAASMLTDKSFNSSNLVGMASGVSEFTKSENAAIIQQVSKADKTLVKLPEQRSSEQGKKVKANAENADNKLREENVSFSQSLSNINDLLQINGTELSFIFDDSADQPVVVVADKKSGNVIRQIPTEEMQKFAARIRELESDPTSTSGLVVDRQA